MTAHVIWELIATPVAENRCDFVDNVWVRTTEKYEQFLAENGITYEQAKANFQAAIDTHNAEETPLFAKSIERKALGRERGRELIPPEFERANKSPSPQRRASLDSWVVPSSAVQEQTPENPARSGREYRRFHDGRTRACRDEPATDLRRWPGTPAPGGASSRGSGRAWLNPAATSRHDRGTLTMAEI